MAQFECELCGAGFEQKSRYERHLQTSHPPQAVSAADLEAVASGLSLPSSVGELVREAERRGKAEVARVLRQLPEQEIRDAAELSRAFGALRSHEAKPDHQPSVLGGERALEAPSAARLAQLFRGVEFPLSRAEVQRLVRERGQQQDAARVEDLPAGPYRDMADVMRQLG